MPDSGGADPGAAEEAAEDVDDGEEDNIHVETGPLLVLEHESSRGVISHMEDTGF
jgi:hypothetical protein